MTKERSQILIRKTCLVAFDILSVIIAFFLSSIIAYKIVYGDMLLSMNY